MRKTIVSFVIIISAAAALVALSFMKPAQGPDIQQGTTDVVTIPSTMKTIDEDSYLFGVTGAYPQFAQVDAAFNAQIADTINEDLVNFKGMANDNYQARLETEGDTFQQQFARNGGFTYDLKTEVVQSNSHFVSVIIRRDTYVGGAHGASAIFVFNYDVAAKKTLSITDFMTLKEASDVSRASLRQILGEETYNGFAIEGTDPSKLENFQAFTFTDKDITIYFGDYQVAPYASGEQRVVISRDNKK
jgi:hypothetical protein